MSCQTRCISGRFWAGSRNMDVGVRRTPSDALIDNDTNKTETH